MSGGLCGYEAGRPSIQPKTPTLTRAASSVTTTFWTQLIRFHIITINIFTILHAYMLQGLLTLTQIRLSVRMNRRGTIPSIAITFLYCMNAALAMMFKSMSHQNPITSITFDHKGRLNTFISITSFIILAIIGQVMKNGFIVPAFIEQVMKKMKMLRVWMQDRTR